MASILTIILFFIYLWGLGYTALFWLKKEMSWLERQCLSLAIGLGIFPILAIILNFLHIPLDWKIFLFLSVAYPIFVLIKKIAAKNEDSISFPQLTLPKVTKADAALFLAILIVLASLFIYTKGAFSYPYLEDEDPWGHSVGVKYVALEKNAYDPPLKEPEKIDPVLSYIDPYPPAYDILLGILHQTSPNLQWTMKFFNALLISLGFLFFYLFAKEFTENRNKAVLATFILASLPAYLSHFIWAHALAVTLFFPTAYAFYKIREEKKWAFIAMLLLASVWVAQNVEQPLKITVMLLILIFVSCVAHSSFKAYQRHFFAVGGGILLSFFWWGTMVFKYGFRDFVRYYTGNKIFPDAETVSGIAQAINASSAATTTAASSSFLDKIASFLRSVTSSGGSGSRAYSAEDFFIAKGENMINNPIGIGIVVSLLTLFAVVYIIWHYRSALVKPKNLWLCVAMLWLLFTFWGVNGQTFPISIMRGPFRMWMWLAIAVSLLAAESSFVIAHFLKRWKIPLTITFVLIIAGIGITSGEAKYQINTSHWPTSGSFTHPAEPWEYGQWFSSIPANTKVFLYTPKDKLAIGYNAMSCMWCEEIINFRKEILRRTAEELHAFLKKEGYEYLVINVRMDSKHFSGGYGEEFPGILQQRYQEILSSPHLFQPVYQKEDVFIVVRVV